MAKIVNLKNHNQEIIGSAGIMSVTVNETKLLSKLNNIKNGIITEYNFDGPTNPITL